MRDENREPDSEDTPAGEPPVEEPPAEEPEDAFAETAVLPPVEPTDQGTALPADAAEATAAEPPVESPSEIDMGPDRRSNAWVWVGLIVGVLIAAAGIGYGWWYMTARPIAVPNLVGKLPPQAVQTINDLGLRLGKVSEIPTDSATSGTIVSQIPAPFSKLKPGAQVSFVLAAAPETSKVPDVIGRDADEAAVELASARLAPKPVESYNANVGSGLVISQLPTVGADVPVGSLVVLAVSRGPAPTQVRVPQLTGLREPDAVALAAASGARVVKLRSVDASVAAGEVVTQTPLPQTTLPYDGIVQYIVSTGAGSAPRQVPSVVGDARAAAQREIRAAGLRVQARLASSPTIPRGTVLSQAPPAGYRTASGTVVSIVVSRGNVTTASVPSLTGMSAKEAERAINSAGLTPIMVEVPSTAGVGRVFGQFPQAETPIQLRLPVIAVVAAN